MNRCAIGLSVWVAVTALAATADLVVPNGGGVPPQVGFDIRRYGANPTNSPSANARAIQRAIDAASARKGRVVVPRGEWISGTLWLRSDVELHLDEGAALKASPDLADYNRADAYPENWCARGEEWNACHFIIGYKVENVTISGPGTIDGNGTGFFEPKPRWKGTEYWREGICLARDRVNLRPGQMVVFVSSKRLRVTDVRMRDAPSWTLFFHGCEDVGVERYTVRNGRLHGNTDGIDIDCCRRVRVVGADIDTGDDGIAVRASERRLLRKPKELPCEDIEISDCTLSSQAMGVRIGVGAGIIRRVRIERVKVRSAAHGFAFQSWFGKPEGSGVDMEDIVIKDSEIGAGAYGAYEIVSGGDEQRTGIRNVRFVGCRSAAEHGGRIAAELRHPVEGLRFESCTGNW